MESLTLHHCNTLELLAEHHATRDASVRAVILERHAALVRSLANKFVRPGICVDDLVQTAWIGLIGALDRYDPSRPNKFSTYAVQCMVGELKRYFRDKTWAVKAPRYIQTVSASLRRAQDRLVGRLQREPTVPEIAEELGVSEEDVLLAMELGCAYSPLGLEEPRAGDDGGASLSLGETFGRTDPRLEQFVENDSLRQALSTLDDRRRSIIEWRFFEGRTQQEVGDRLSLSQMHISRLERSALRELNATMRLQSAGPGMPA
jgi:RNA polymerase sigma-B factor